MMQDTARPPKPRAAIRVGVTGHRPVPDRHGCIKLLPDAVPAVTATVSRVLDAIVAAAEATRADNADVFAEPDAAQCVAGTGVEGVVVSGLAPGADQIVARQALDRRFRLDAVIPFARDEYRTDHEKAGTVAAFEALADSARACFALDGTRAAEARAYEAAGLVMLANVDILIAVWDRGPPQGRGGTAEIVQRAVADGMPVVLIEPARPEVARLVWTGIEPLPPASARLEDLGKGDRDPTFAAVVRPLLAPPAAGTALPDRRIGRRTGRFLRAIAPVPRSRESHGTDEQQIPLTTYLGEVERLRYGRLERFYPRLLSLLTDRRFGPDDRRTRPYVSATREAWAPFHAGCPAAAPSVREHIDATLLPAFAFADKLGVHYALLYRGAFVASYLLAATAVGLALLGVWPWVAKGPWLKAGLVAAEVVLIGIILWIYVQGSASRWHARFLAYRRLAEVLRPMRVLALVGAPDPVGRPQGAAGPAESFVPWYARAIRRTIPLPHATVDARYLKAVRAVAADCRDAHGRPASEIEGQIAYHRATARRMHEAEEGLHAWGERLFKGTLFVGIAFLAIVALVAATGEPGLGEFTRQGHPAWHAKWLTTFLMALFPTLGAALSAIRVQGDFEATSRRSARTRSRLKRIRRAMLGEAGEAEGEKDGPGDSEAGPASLALTSDRMVKAVDAMQTDLAQWHALSRTRPLSLPA